jgi:hypothetical protein
MGHDNGRFVTRREAYFAISRYLAHLPKGYRKPVYEEYLKEMTRLKLLRKVNSFKFEIINKQASQAIEVKQETEKDWF